MMNVDPGRWSVTFTDFVDGGELRLPFDPDTGRPLSLHDRRHDGLGDAPAAEWRRAAGTGVVVSHVVFHRKYGEDAPAILALIGLDEGHRLVAPLVDVAAEDVVAGLPVEVVDRPADGPARGPLAFRPVRASP